MKEKKTKKITQGGMTDRMPDIILTMPELFFFDMRAYMRAVNAAKSIDFYSRVELYDMYESAMLDPHLSGVIDKRRIGVTKIPVEFRINGKPDERINNEIKSPWFRKLLKDIIMSHFWGYALFQFFRDDDGNITYTRIPYKHFDPVKKVILKNQTDDSGQPMESFGNMLLVGEDPRDIGMLAELVPYVLYKRGNMADWAQFAQIFGMPIREYTYDAGDEEARKKLLQDARRQGANAVYIHPVGSTLNIIESSNKSGTVDLYERLKDACNTEISVRVLGNTLTTAVGDKGTQALGTVHKEEEEDIKSDDRKFILDVLNYGMRDIFAAFGMNTSAGEFVYVDKTLPDPTKQADVIMKAKAMGLPVSDDYMYEVLGIDKPDNYDEMKAEMLAEKERMEKLQTDGAGDDGDRDDRSGKKSLKDRLKGFFVFAPKGDGALPF